MRCTTIRGSVLEGIGAGATFGALSRTPRTMAGLTRDSAMVAAAGAPLRRDGRAPGR